MNDRGSADLLLLASILVGTLIGARFAVSVMDVFDTVAAHITIYAAAVVAAITLWRRLVQPIRRGMEILFGLDHRVERIEQRQVKIEQHLGLEPEPVTEPEA
jgi:membrane protein implicated in regulation of membrane protease activity